MLSLLAALNSRMNPMNNTEMKKWLHLRFFSASLSSVRSIPSISIQKLVVKAVAEDRDYAKGQVGGTFSYTLNGIVAGDEGFLGEAVYAGSAVSAENAGTYTLSVSLPEFTLAGNYDIQYVDDNEFVIREVKG